MAAILRAVLSMSAINALSRTTGYLRTMVMAAVLGTGAVANAYGASNGIANLIYELFLGGILYSAFIPLLVERITTHGEEDARRLTSAVLTLILPSLAAVVLLGIVFAEPVVDLATRFQGSTELSPDEAQRTTELSIFFFRFFVIYIFFFGLGSVLTGVLNAHRRFFLPTFGPVLNNLFAITCFGGYALLVPRNPTAAVYLLAATTLGVALTALILLPPAWRLGYKPRPVFGHPSLLPALRLAIPVLVFTAGSLGVQFVGLLLSSSFGAVAQLGYAFVIFSLPYGIFVLAIETATMPELSEQYARGDIEGYRDTLSFGLRTMAFIVVPSSVGLIACALSSVTWVVGVALALSGANAVFALVCLAAMRREIGHIGARRLLRSLFKILVAGAAMYVVALFGTSLLGEGSNALERAGILVVAGGASLAAYLGTAFLLKAEELKSAIALLRRRVAGAEG